MKIGQHFDHPADPHEISLPASKIVIEEQGCHAMSWKLVSVFEAGLLAYLPQTILLHAGCALCLRAKRKQAVPLFSRLSSRIVRAETQEGGSGWICGKQGYRMCSRTTVAKTIARTRPCASDL